MMHIATELGIEPSALRRWFTQERGGVVDLGPTRPLQASDKDASCVGCAGGSFC